MIDFAFLWKKFKSDHVLFLQTIMYPCTWLGNYDLSAGASPKKLIVFKIAAPADFDMTLGHIDHVHALHFFMPSRLNRVSDCNPIVIKIAPHSSLAVQSLFVLRRNHVLVHTCSIPFAGRIIIWCRGMIMVLQNVLTNLSLQLSHGGLVFIPYATMSFNNRYIKLYFRWVSCYYKLYSKTASEIYTTFYA